MYNFTLAKRVEVNSNPAKQLDAILHEPLPPQAEFVGESAYGTLFKVTLPASVWALAIRSAEGICVGYYHAPIDADSDIREALNAKPKKAKV